MKIINEVPPVLDAGRFVAIDTEFFKMQKGKLHRPTGEFACMQICFDPKTVYMIYDPKQIKNALKAISKATWVFHNAMFDIIQLRRYTDIKPRFVWDIMLVEQAMCGGLYQNFSLKDLVRRHLGLQMEKESREDFENGDFMTEKMKTYAATDAVRTLQIAEKQKEQWDDCQAFRAYKEVDAPMIWPLLDMPGIPVDVDGWKKMVEGFKADVQRLEGELGINSMSGQQVIKAARSFGVHIDNTRAVTLAEFQQVPFIAKVLEARMYRKAVSTYGETWLENSVESDGKVYSSYHVTGAETGRMSSSNPNMQQIPARKLPQYRARFIASPKSLIRVSDVSQQEPRILAYESKDSELMKIFKSGGDSHLEVARTIFHEPNMKKSDPRRKNEGKTVNLGTSYGLSEYGLSIRLGISEEEAAKFLHEYFSRFHGVHNWIGLQRNFALSHEWVKTALGRRIYINTYTNQWQNNAINSPIQGGAADFTKIWVRKIWEKCREAKIPFFIVAIVHDEVVQDVLKELVKTADRIVTEAFNETAKFLYPTVPFAFETEMGRSWACKQMPEEIITLEDE